MPGILLPRTGQFDPTLDAPARYGRACKYDAFVPTQLADLSVVLDAVVAGVVSEAEQAIHELNAYGAPDLTAMARLLLRSESIASSKIERMQLDVRELARAEARMDTGAKVSDTARDVLANIDALAVENAASGPGI